jgi:hypothetical protein
LPERSHNLARVVAQARRYLVDMFARRGRSAKPSTPTGSEPAAQPESPAAQTITQAVRSEDIQDLSHMSLGPASASEYH